ncbi:hypothetical protein [Flavobacterium suzhouense]|uniref:Uncharacterized protein n=1 Tax=Flavobacterium suzhouense TaxID=1529638 RepID=A0ABW5NV01_9FLAO
MKITFEHILIFCTTLFISMVIGYLADTLFDVRWYGYLAVGAAISCFLYINSQPKPFMETAHPYLRFGIGILVLLLIFSALGFLGHIIFGIDFVKPILFGFIITFTMFFNQRKTTIKKQ